MIWPGRKAPTARLVMVLRMAHPLSPEVSRAPLMHHCGGKLNQLEGTKTNSNNAI
jgi:hypothetical protein